ncbi:hypothetical protein niasHT_020322 [Heterodera trifolii]|uniref:Uncharacterized protein n=1 Tax=Heterodera trifolii TaxID=157864 RepID=A0ABD2K437_9BILA
MKLMLRLIVLCACFWSAKLLSCRKEIIGTVQQSFVDKEAKNASIACPEIDGAGKLKFCVKEVCFRDGKVEHYVTIYACSVTTADCNTAGRLFMARQECQVKNNGNTNACKEEKNKHEGNYIKNYGNYRCEQCEYGKENEDNGNANFPLYKPKVDPPKPEISSTAPLPNPETSSVPVSSKPQNGIDIVFSDMDIPLGVPPSAGSGRRTEPGIGHHFVMVFAAVALVGTAIRHGILL